VVQPAHGAYPELLAKTEGGILSEPDSPIDLAAKLDSLARERDHLRELGRNAADGVRRHFAIESVAQRSVEIYQSVLAERQALRR
jgi:glycosyltransferase involved in cell wall biosynthesis